MTDAVEDLDRVRRLAKRIGFGTPTITEAGNFGKALDFHMPVRPPYTFSRMMASSITFAKVSDPYQKPDEDDSEWGYNEITVRFPTSDRATEDQMDAAGRAALEAVDDYPSGVFRWNPVIETPALHYDIAPPDISDWPPEELLRETWTLGQAFNDEMGEVV
jgi:hypothetical protein